MWDDAAAQTTATATGLAPGNYTVTLTDDNLCTFTTTPSVTITEPDVLVIGSMSMDSVSCNGLSDGIATANAITGGNGTNTFSWNTAPIQTTNPATGLAAGNYTITVTDSEGCSTCLLYTSDAADE